MTIGSIGSNSALTTSLQAQGLSTNAIKLVETDLQQVQTAGGSSSTSVDGATVRAALDQKISDDVASGKLSQDDADKIGKALDQMDGSATANGSATTASAGGTAGAGHAGGGAPAGGGGGGGSSEKTELSRTVTVSGGIKTTVITYTDGTTETKTTVDVTDKDTSAKGKVEDKDKIENKGRADKNGKTSGADTDAKAGDKAVGDPTADPTTQAYLSQIEPGSLFDAYA